MWNWAATGGNHGVDLLVTIAVAVIAALPGLLGLYVTWRRRKFVREATATEFGTKLAQTAFRNMETQVQRLSAEQDRWQAERTSWDRDRSELLARISHLSDQLHLTNQYLQLLLATLDGHGIERPAPPPGLDSWS